MGIHIKDAMHYTLHDLVLEITLLNERDRKMAWEVGARVLEAVGCAFSKKHKYSEAPIIMTNEEAKDRERQKYYEFINNFKRSKINGK